MQLNQNGSYLCNTSSIAIAVIGMDPRQAVWPDAGIQSSPKFQKVAQMVATEFLLEKWRITKWPKCCKKF